MTVLINLYTVSMARSILISRLNSSYVVKCKKQDPIDQEETDDEKYICYISKRPPVGKRP